MVNITSPLQVPKLHKFKGELTTSPKSTSGHRALYKRARSKCIGLPFVTALTDYAKHNGSHLEKAYRDSIYCCHTAHQEEDGGIKGSYCGRRWCIVCNRIRTAKQIENYMPSLSEWEAPQFITLTRRSVDTGAIAGCIDDSLRVLSAIKDAMRKHRTAPLKLEAVRKMEITYHWNHTGQYFHVHFHFIVRTEEMGRRLIQGWLDRLGEDAMLQGQDARPVDSGALMEMFKYATKLAVKDKDGKNRPVPPEALDAIFRALYRRRTLQPVGFRLKKPEVEEDAPLDVEGKTAAWKRLGEEVLWEWDQDVADWIDQATGEALTGHRKPVEDEQEAPEGQSLPPCPDRDFLDTLETTSEHQPEKGQKCDKKEGKSLVLVRSNHQLEAFNRQQARIVQRHSRESTKSRLSQVRAMTNKSGFY